ncbi:helix-turn-helix domain-containing protein [Pseudomonas aeruginosa]|uniref:helix-turn-helix domain-containing protein n=1 Tax=Pseudomonas aeruginosa TaxID=287 RepID=UPI001F0988FF|nr:helix-turn-helix domain-containing protein [Pseudomonas aeruginosa]
MSPAQKAVLISLADQANDQGVCWPAVDSIATRCCLSKRAVQQAIKWLRSVGIVSVEERQGRSTMYSVTPAAYAPPQEMPPPQEMHPEP